MSEGSPNRFLGGMHADKSSGVLLCCQVAAAVWQKP